MVTVVVPFAAKAAFETLLEFIGQMCDRVTCTVGTDEWTIVAGDRIDGVYSIQCRVDVRDSIVGSVEKLPFMFTADPRVLRKLFAPPSAHVRQIVNAYCAANCLPTVNFDASVAIHIGDDNVLRATMVYDDGDDAADDATCGNVHYNSL